jgi:hypothetical protein
MQELLHKTAKHDEQLERFKLQMMLQDIKHRKSLLLLRVAGLPRLAPHFAYFNEVTATKGGKSKIEKTPI